MADTAVMGPRARARADAIATGRLKTPDYEWLKKHWRQDEHQMKRLNSCYNHDLGCTVYWPDKAR